MPAGAFRSQAQRQPAREEDAERLADDQPDRDGDDNTPRRAIERPARDRDARIGEREDRHDAERDPRMERLDQALGGRHALHGARRRRGAGSRRARATRARSGAPAPDARSPCERRRRIHPGRATRGPASAGRRRRPRSSDESRPRRCPPTHDRGHDVGQLRAHAEALHREDAAEPERGDEQPGERNARRVEERDDDDGAEVVDDREREEEDAQRSRNALAEQREDADREGDVGRHRNAPARSRCGAHRRRAR